MSSRKAGFAAVTVGYLATTTSEALLAASFPLIAHELDLGPGFAGLAFGVLAGSIAVGGLVGGFALARLGPRAGLVPGVGLASLGAALSAASGGTALLLAAQVVVGLGSGTFFASGLRSAAVFAGDRRRGRAMGFFGIAFSGGMALAGALAALGQVWGWRVSFGVVAALGALVAAALTMVSVPVGRSRAPRPPGRPLLAGFGVPVAVGGVAAASQYGTVAFMTLYAVEEWDVSPATAALLLTGGRLLAVPAKLVSGHASDRAGALRTARVLGVALALLGVCWTVPPGPVFTAWAAVVFIGCVSGMGPLANVLALERLEHRDELLGAFRAAQIGVAAIAAALLGLCAELFGLHVSLAVAATVIPASILLLPAAERRAQRGSRLSPVRR